jgi:hypothetical protein
MASVLLVSSVHAAEKYYGPPPGKNNEMKSLNSRYFCVIYCLFI